MNKHLADQDCAQTNQSDALLHNLPFLALPWTLDIGATDISLAIKSTGRERYP
jgi:hypothetical protein